MLANGDRPARPRFWQEWALLSAGRGAAAVAGAATFLVASRHTSTAVFGQVAWALSLATVVTILLDTGTSQIVLRHGTLGGPNAGRRGWDLLPRLAAGLAGAAVIGLAAAAHDLHPRHLGPLGLTGFVVVNAALVSVESLCLSALVATRRTRAGAALVVADRLVGVGVLLAVGGTGRWTLALVLSQVAAYALPLVLLRGIVGRLAPAGADAGPVAGSERVAFMQSSAATQAQNLEVPIVAAISGATQAAYMGLASRLTGPLSIVTAAGSTLVLRRRDERDPQDERVAGALGRHEQVLVGSVTAIPLLVVAALPSGWLVVLLGHGYAHAVTPLRLVLLTVAVNAFVAPIGARLQRAGRTPAVARVITTCTVLGLAACALGAVARGATGGATGMLVSQTVQLLWFLRLARPQVPAHPVRAESGVQP